MIEQRTWRLTRGQILFTVGVILLAAFVLLYRPYTGMWDGVYVKAARAWQENGAYVPPSPLTPTYPLWGYPLVAIAAMRLAPGNPVLLASCAQVACAVVLLLALFLPLITDSRDWLVGLLVPAVLPVLTGAAQPTADAVYLLGMLAILACLRPWITRAMAGTHGTWILVTAAAAWAVAANMRSEALLCSVTLAIAVAVCWLAARTHPAWRTATRAALVFWLVITLGALVGLIPWWLHSRSATGQGLLGATNSGHVMWISLGQLPGNPWGRVPLDRVGGTFSRAHGWGSTFSARGDAGMKAAFLGDIRQYPEAFARKLGFNAAAALWEGPPLTPMLAGGVNATSPASQLAAAAESVLQMAYRAMLLLLGVGCVLVLGSRDVREAMPPASGITLVSLTGLMLCSVAILSIGLWVPRLGTPIYALVVYGFCIATREFIALRGITLSE